MVACLKLGCLPSSSFLMIECDPGRRASFIFLKFQKYEFNFFQKFDWFLPFHTYLCRLCLRNWPHVIQIVGLEQFYYHAKYECKYLELWRCVIWMIKSLRGKCSNLSVLLNSQLSNGIENIGRQGQNRKFTFSIPCVASHNTQINTNQE